LCKITKMHNLPPFSETPKILQRFKTTINNNYSKN